MTATGSNNLPLHKRLVCEAMGTGTLVMAVIGSGIMSSRLAGENVALGLLAHSLAVGAALVVILLISIPLSGGHINPALTLAFLLRKGISMSEAALYVGAQCLGALAATALTHLMYDLPVFTWSVPYLPPVSSPG